MTSSSSTAPCCTISNPAAILSAVDFPHPEGPNKQTTSPSYRESERSLTAKFSPYRCHTSVNSKAFIFTRVYFYVEKTVVYTNKV